MLNAAGFQGRTSTLTIDWPPAKPASKREGGSGAEGICLLLKFVHICLRASRLHAGFQNKEFFQESINGNFFRNPWMVSFVTGEIEYICFRINSYLLETGSEFSLFFACSGWVLSYFREKQWSIYCLSANVLTSRDTKVTKPSRGLLAVQGQTGQRLIVGKTHRGSTEKSLI